MLDKIKRVESVSDNRILPSNFNRNNIVVSKKENLNGFVGQGQSIKVNNDAAKFVNRDRVVQGTSSVVDVTSTTKIL